MGIPGITKNGSNTSGETIAGTGGDDALSGTYSSEVFKTGGGDDWVYADGGNDTVHVGFGKDWLHGGEGFDTLYFALLNDIAPGMYDENHFNLTVDLAKSVQKLGLLGTKTIYGFEAIIGGYGNDKFYGSSHANSLDGFEGNDQLDGRAGNDTLIGNLGADTLIGGAGGDRLGGYIDGALSSDGKIDYFRYLSTSDSSATVPANTDDVWGYFTGGALDGDRIDLSRIDADGSLKSGNGTFKFIGQAAFDHKVGGEVRFVQLSVNTYRVEVDTDKDTGAEMAITVHSYNGLLEKGDFIL